MSFAPLYPLLHRLLKPTFSRCLWSGHPDTPTIALTFDDGPHPEHTPPLLKVLDNYQVPATFFCLGSAVDRTPELAREIYQKGHWIGLHGYSHRAFVGMAPSELKSELEQTQAAIIRSLAEPTAKACPLDFTTLRDVRPPYGAFTPQTLSLLNQWNYRPVMWSIIPEDWTLPGVSIVVQRVLDQVQNGAIIVLHDGPEGGSATAQTVDQLIPLLKNSYQFTTVDQLWCAASN